MYNFSFVKYSAIYMPLFVGGLDYDSVSVDLTFLPGASTGDIQCVNVNITDDTVVEDDEPFSVHLSSTDSAVNIAVADATVTINQDNDSMFVHSFYA